MIKTKQAAQQEANSVDPSNTQIQRLLRQRARERAAPLMWNINSLILTFITFTTVIILSLKEVDFSIIALAVILGMGSLWIFSRIQVRKLENKFFEEEMRNYAELSSDEPPSKSDEAETSSLVSPVESPLTSRELDILGQMAKGRTNKEIAHALQISAQTVKNHTAHIYWKLDVNDRTSAVLVAMSRGWVEGNHVERT